MKRPKKTSWKDTNLALIGSDLDKKIKEAAAKTEPQWKGIGTSEKLYVWRIEQFVVKPWPKSKYGKFYTGDSYVILNSYKANPAKPKLSHNLHIWIGNESTQDEYGTAAYKMVEADDVLKGAAKQHREVQGKESKLFLSYFNDKVTYLSGGVASGFTNVSEEESKAEPRLYWIKGRGNSLSLTQVQVRRDSMNSGDVFILDAGDGTKVWLWVGKDSNVSEKRKGMEVARGFCTKGNVIVLDQGVNDGETQAQDFWTFMPAKVSKVGVFKKSYRIQEADEDDDKVKRFIPLLFKLPDTGTGKISRVSKAKLTDQNQPGKPEYKFKRTDLLEAHSFLLDTGFNLFIWIGRNVLTSTRVAALGYSEVYCSSYKRPFMAVTVVKSGQEDTSFNHYFYDPPPTPTSSSLCTYCTIS